MGVSMRCIKAAHPNDWIGMQRPLSDGSTLTPKSLAYHMIMQPEAGWEGRERRLESVRTGRNQGVSFTSAGTSHQGPGLGYISGEAGESKG